MTDKQLKRLALASGWIEHRKGGKHEIWRHPITGQQMTIPYRPKQHTAKLIAKRLAAAT